MCWALASAKTWFCLLSEFQVTFCPWAQQTGTKMLTEGVQDVIFHFWLVAYFQSDVRVCVFSQFINSFVPTASLLWFSLTAPVSVFSAVLRTGSTAWQVQFFILPMRSINQLFGDHIEPLKVNIELAPINYFCFVCPEYAALYWNNVLSVLMGYNAY